MRVPEALGALREREFRLLFTGQAISLLGDGMVGVALAFAVLDLTGSVTDLGLVFAAKTIPLVVFLLVGGVLADRLPRRAVMLDGGRRPPDDTGRDRRAAHLRPRDDLGAGAHPGRLRRRDGVLQPGVDRPIPR